MRIDSVRVGFSLVMLVGGAGVVLGACASSAPDQPFVTSGTAGSTGRMPPLVDGGTVCTADGGAVAPPVMGGGPQPTIPTTITRQSTPVPPLSGGTLLALADGTTVAASDPERDQVNLVDHVDQHRPRARWRCRPATSRGVWSRTAAGRCTWSLRRGGAVVTIDPSHASRDASSRDRRVCAAPRGDRLQTGSGPDPRRLRGRRARVACPPRAGRDADADARSRSARRRRGRGRVPAGEHIPEGRGARRRRRPEASRRGCARARGACPTINGTAADADAVGGVADGAARRRARAAWSCSTRPASRI